MEQIGPLTVLSLQGYSRLDCNSQSPRPRKLVGQAARHLEAKTSCQAEYSHARADVLVCNHLLSPFCVCLDRFLQWAAALRSPGAGRHGRSSGEPRALQPAAGRVQRGVRRREAKGMMVTLD